MHKIIHVQVPTQSQISEIENSFHAIQRQSIRSINDHRTIAPSQFDLLGWHLARFLSFDRQTHGNGVHTAAAHTRARTAAAAPWRQQPRQKVKPERPAVGRAARRQLCPRPLHPPDNNSRLTHNFYIIFPRLRVSAQRQMYAWISRYCSCLWFCWQSINWIGDEYLLMQAVRSMVWTLQTVPTKYM